MGDFFSDKLPPVSRIDGPEMLNELSAAARISRLEPGHEDAGPGQKRRRRDAAQREEPLEVELPLHQIDSLA